jgi:hypothetical protein
MRYNFVFEARGEDGSGRVDAGTWEWGCKCLCSVHLFVGRKNSIEPMGSMRICHDLSNMLRRGWLSRGTEHAVCRRISGILWMHLMEFCSH